PRLAIYPAYLNTPEEWLAPEPLTATLHRQDTSGLGHETSWRVGRDESDHVFPVAKAAISQSSPAIRAIDAAMAGRRLDHGQIVSLFEARGTMAEAVAGAADALRRERVGDTVRYVVTRNINYTNVCSYACTFSAFSKGKTAEHLRGRPYDLEPAEIARRVAEAWERGGVEGRMRGGLRPGSNGHTSQASRRIVKQAVPDIHVHALSPLEVHHGATSLGIPVRDYLLQLKEAGLGSLPGTAAEILHDEVRERLCAGKLTTDAWFNVIETAHGVG